MYQKNSIHFYLFYFSFSGGLLDPCGYINPESPVVQLGSNFTAVCVLKEKCMDYFHVNANYIFWKTNHVTVPKEQYTVINRTASSVTFTNISLLNIQLTCNIRTFGQIDQNVYGIRIISGCKFCFVFVLLQILWWLLNYIFNVCWSLWNAVTCRLSDFYTYIFLKNKFRSGTAFVLLIYEKRKE